MTHPHPPQVSSGLTVEVGRLRRIAEAATPGRREFGDNGVFMAPESSTILALVKMGVMSPHAEDIEFWTTFDPPTVLSLLSALEGRGGGDKSARDLAPSDDGGDQCSLATETVANADEPLLGQAWGALNFILAFYEPGQSHLDTNAWKQAEASGRRAHAALSERLGIALGDTAKRLLRERAGQ